LAPAGATEISPARRVNAPYTPRVESIPAAERAIFWFGQVTPTENYADTRVIYNDEALFVTLHIFDRRLWYNTTPVVDEFTDWDAASLHIDLDGNVGNAPDVDSYRFVAQLNQWQPRAAYQAAYRGDGSDWQEAAIAYTTDSGWRGQGLNNGAFARGWNVTFKIPFTSLGLASRPADGAEWALSLTVHDRDDEAGTPIPEQVWPENADGQSPATWGQLRFGLPVYRPPFANQLQQVTIRQGLNEAEVVDAHVGGHTNGCGTPNSYETWGSLNYAGYEQINVQNQWDVSDWPCFSKYYVTFPLDGLPPGKVIARAELTMNQFGNSGQGWDPGPQPSFIQILTIEEDWDEDSITWNNAPLAAENFGGAWVDPVEDHSGVDRKWNVSRAVAEAYSAGEPLRLALYSADGARHSGKYFRSSDIGDWGAEKRPTLRILVGDPAEPTDWVHLPLIAR
jgi:hypothetical protein